MVELPVLAETTRFALVSGLAIFAGICGAALIALVVGRLLAGRRP